jgi:hypothetical protein
MFTLRELNGNGMANGACAVGQTRGRALVFDCSPRGRREVHHGRCEASGRPVRPTRGQSRAALRAARVVNDSTTHMELGWPEPVRVMFNAHAQQRGTSCRCRQVYDLEGSQGRWPFRAQTD